MNRRQFLRATAARFSVAGLCEAGLAEAGYSHAAADPHAGKALIAITLDLEMSRNFPRWEDTHWDYEKGNLNDETKRYAVEACRRVKAAGGVVHCFAVGRVCEQANVDWLKEIAAAGHPIGNHTYDHVHMKATKPADIQFRFQRAPWLAEGKTAEQIIVENIRQTTAALKARIGIEPAGFRTPGGFPNGLADRPDIRRWLRDLGYAWVSSKYPAHPAPEPGREPSEMYLGAIVRAQADAQPFTYPNGLVEVPMSPVSDIVAFRTGRWKLEWFLRTLRRAIDSVIDARTTFDFLGHPSCLYVVDPEFRAIELIIERVRASNGRALLIGLGAHASRGGGAG